MQYAWGLGMQAKVHNRGSGAVRMDCTPCSCCGRMGTLRVRCMHAHFRTHTHTHTLVIHTFVMHTLVKTRTMHTHSHAHKPHTHTHTRTQPTHAHMHTHTGQGIPVLPAPQECPAPWSCGLNGRLQPRHALCPGDLISSITSQHSRAFMHVNVFVCVRVCVFHLCHPQN
jgi:hypothetical protein